MGADGEDRLLRWLRHRLGSGNLLGDDAAILPAAASQAVTVDSQIEGIHFPSGLDPALLARRVLAVNLSDLAAMGAVPTYAFLALSSAAGFDHRRFFRALLSACREHRIELAGGDLAHCPDRTIVTLTLLGMPAEGGAFVRRGGARAGHNLWVGGSLGESAAGCLLVARGACLERGRVRLPQGLYVGRDLRRAARRAVVRHLSPEPQLSLGRWLATMPEAAALDISDGLALDLRRLSEASGVGAEVERSALPMAADFAGLCEALGEDPLALALGGGEDYVLLFTLPPGVRPPEGFGCHRIGAITASRRLRLLDGTASRPLPRLGWDHLARRLDP